MTKQKVEFYSLEKINKKKTQYKMIFGKRSNGKTYAVLDRMIKRYFESGVEGAYIRRFSEDMRGKNGQTLFNNLVEKHRVEKYS